MRIALIDQLEQKLGATNLLVRTLRALANMQSESPGTFVYGAQQTHVLGAVPMALPPGLGPLTLTLLTSKPGIYVPRAGRFTKLVVGQQLPDPTNAGIMASFTVRTPGIPRATSPTFDLGGPAPAVLVVDVDIPVNPGDRVNVTLDPTAPLVAPAGALSAILV